MAKGITGPWVYQQIEAFLKHPSAERCTINARYHQLVLSAHFDREDAEYMLKQRSEGKLAGFSFEVRLMLTEAGPFEMYSSPDAQALTVANVIYEDDNYNLLEEQVVNGPSYAKQSEQIETRASQCRWELSGAELASIRRQNRHDQRVCQ